MAQTLELVKSLWVSAAKAGRLVLAEQSIHRPIYKVKILQNNWLIISNAKVAKEVRLSSLYCF